MADDNSPGLTDAYDELSPKQRRFVDAMVSRGKSQTDAAREAGYGGKRPDCAANRLMKTPIVRAAYEQRREQAAKAAGVDGIRILHELAIIGFDRKVGKATRLKSLELLGKNQRLWVEKHEHSGPGGQSLAPPVFNISFADGGPGK